ncbi:MAG: sensor domain-containing protein [Acidobacteriota bacterium]
MSTLESIENAATAEITQRNPVAEFCLAPLRWRTYSNLLYLWLAFPLGLFYFVALTVGFSISVGLLIIWVGVLTLLLTLLFVWTLGGLERGLATGLLGAQIPQRPLPSAAEVGILRWLGGMLRSPALYKSIVFLGLKFPLGLACWVGSVVGLSVSVAFIASPLALWFGTGDLDLGIWSVDSVTDTIPLAVLGVVLLLVTLNLQNGAAWVFRFLAEWLLGSEEGFPAAPAAPPVVRGETAGVLA